MTGTDPTGRPARVVAFVPDLMDRSRLGRLGSIEVVHARNPSDLVDIATAEDLVVVDLSRTGVLDVLGQVAGEVVGFASHVDAELLAAAAASGCGEVLPRSRFFAGLARRVVGEAEATSEGTQSQSQVEGTGPGEDATGPAR